MATWQIAAGDGTRDYADVFLRFGVILVGPGSEGDYFSNTEVYNDPNSWAYRSFLRPLAETMEIGELLVLKRPASQYRWEIVAVGEVNSCYSWESVFEDVDGWDLQHCRRVSWRKPLTRTIISGLRRGTLYTVKNREAIEKINQIWSTGEPVAPVSFPSGSEEIGVDQLIDDLMVEGLPGQNAELIASTIWRLRRVAKWYSSHGQDVGEHEIRTFLIVPLLTSLGWAEQRIKIEWRRVDVALFDKPYSQDSKPLVFLESKRLWDGLRFASDQASGYAQAYSACTRLVVSDGIRYKLYRREGDDWPYAAYMNLLAPRRTHPYDLSVDGAVSFFLSLLPKGAI